MRKSVALTQPILLKGVAMIELTGALASAKAAYDLLKSAFAARDEALIKSAMVELQQKHVELGESAMALLDKAFSLQTALIEANNENAELKMASAKRDAYVLHEIKTGAFCYTAKPSAENAEPPHYLCQICWDKGVKSVLKFQPASRYYVAMYRCMNMPDKAHDIYL